MGGGVEHPKTPPRYATDGGTNGPSTRRVSHHKLRNFSLESAEKWHRNYERRIAQMSSPSGPIPLAKMQAHVTCQDRLSWVKFAKFSRIPPCRCKADMTATFQILFNSPHPFHTTRCYNAWWNKLQIYTGQHGLVYHKPSYRQSRSGTSCR